MRAELPDQLRRALRSKPAILVAALVLIWAMVPFLPEQSGLRFSWVYRIFFSAMAVIAVLFFWFLDKKPVPLPRSPATALGGVILGTVAVVVVAGLVYPSFPVPHKAAAVSGAVARGKQVFFSPSTPCFRCHMIAGKGGRRGPDLTHIASIAGKLVPGLTAEQFLTAKIQAGGTYKYKAPKFSPIMPPFKALLTQTQLKDLVAFLMTQK